MQLRSIDKYIRFSLILYVAIARNFSSRNTMSRDELRLWPYGYNSSDLAEFLSKRKTETRLIGYQA